MSLYELIRQIIKAFKEIFFPWLRSQEEPDWSHME